MAAQNILPDKLSVEEVDSWLKRIDDCIVALQEQRRGVQQKCTHKRANGESTLYAGMQRSICTTCNREVD